MKFTRHFTDDRPIADQIQWKTVHAMIPGTKVDTLVEVPESWTPNAANILAKNYLRKAGVPDATWQPPAKIGSPEWQGMPNWIRPSKPMEAIKFGSEKSAKQVFHRMAGHWTYVGWKHGYFRGAKNLDSQGIGYNHESAARIFYDEIYWMLANQIAAPNSPQWFNTGLWWAYGITGPASGQWAIDYTTGEPFETKSAYEYPQPHACFIQPVSDDLVNPGGIMDLWTREVRLFKQGSGTGSNFSNVRGKNEPLSGGGVSSGLMSFLRIGDVAADAIASGGTTRRAAKMVCLDLDHPEVEDFIDWKVGEQRKALAMNIGARELNDGGEIYGIEFEGSAINTVSGQNSNNSVRITDQFLRKVDNGEPWDLKARTTREVVKTLPSDELWAKICRAAWACADPGVQFHDTINAWHTCKADGEIKASNPCSEYMFLDNTACNLASLNLVNALLRNINKDPLNEDILDLKRFEHATRIWTVVLDISVSMASFPSREIALGSYNYRTLGLGYANVGGLLHRLGLSYDSDEGRNLIAALTALMHGQAYLTSSQLAFELGSFPRWEVNRDSMAKVLQKHKDAVKNLSTEYYIAPIVARALTVWEPLGGGCAFRNAQVTLLAPTGTISFVMGCETTGIEPFTAPTITKSLAGGGEMAIENSVPESECAFPSRPGGPCLRPMAHVLMVAAVQPFLSGAVSKTVNMPNSATVEDVDSVYREAGRLGLKSVAIYRDGSKLSQPLNTTKPAEDEQRSKLYKLPFWTEGETPDLVSSSVLDRGERERLPDRCSGYRQKFRVADHPAYLHTGEYPDGRLGEIFIEMSDEGSTLRAMANALAKAVSIGIQHGTPVEEYIEAFVNARFEPAGIVEGHTSIKICSSILSAIFRDLGIHYFARTDLMNEKESVNEELTKALPPLRSVGAAASPKASGQFCSCGTLMTQTGSCLTCPNCGNNTGCG